MALTYVPPGTLTVTFLDKPDGTPVHVRVIAIDEIGAPWVLTPGASRLRQAHPGMFLDKSNRFMFHELVYDGPGYGNGCE